MGQCLGAGEKEHASGQAVIPANVRHREAEPTVIGEKFRTKVNANLGTTGKISNLDAELEKLREALLCGADTVMDLSVGEDSGRIRRAMLCHSADPEYRVWEQETDPEGSLTVQERLEPHETALIEVEQIL